MAVNRWYFQRLGKDQLSADAIVSGLIASGAIGSLNQIADGLFTANAAGRGKFADGFLVSSLVAAGALGGGLVRDAGILSGKYAAESIRTADLGLAQILSSIIGANVIGTPHIQNQGILSASIGANIMGTPHIQNQGILSASIGANIIATPHVQNQGILSAAIGANILDTAHIRNQGILSAAIGANILATPHILAGGILSASIGGTAIGTGHIANAAITSALVTALGIGIGHLAANAVVSGKLGSGAIPDSSVSEAQLVSGISIDIGELLQEPTTLAVEPISGHACVMFLSGYSGKRVGVAFANDPNKMPAIGKIGGTNIASGAAMTTNPILTYGRQPSPIGSGNVGKLAYVGTNGQPTVVSPSASGSLVQIIGQTIDNDGAIFLYPQPFAIQIAA